ncbi:MAG: FG-GAP-like repeat-containing protein [Acidobacteriota bacterium]
MKFAKLFVLALSVALIRPVFAQAPPARPPIPHFPNLPRPQGTPQAGETAQPGPTPHVMTYDEWAKSYYKTYRVPAAGVVRVGPNRVKPFPLINVIMQVVGREGDQLLVRNLPPEDPQSAAYEGWKYKQQREVFLEMKKEYFKDKYLIVDGPDIIPPFTDKLTFELRQAGLPAGGRWQMSFDVADMNGDGLPDLVLPPQRTGGPYPAIFLQQKDGSWQLWKDVKWPNPKEAKLDYGTVRVADFDGDGHPDIAIACHFGRTFVMYGNGKGDFSKVVEIPQVNDAVTSRSLAVADLNGDGRPDLATMAELDVQMGTGQRLLSGLINVALNLPTGWQAVGRGQFTDGIQGDWLSAADIDRDGKVDLLLTSRAENIMDLVYRNLGGGEQWKAIASEQMPVNSFVLANAAAPLDRFPSPDLAMCFEQYNPWVAEPPTEACAVYHFHDAQGKPSLVPRPVVLFKEKEENVNYKAMAVGDIDGDGRNDLVIGSNDGRIRVFLQFPDGTFYEQHSPAFKLANTDIFDVKIVDLDHSGMGSIVAMGAPREQTGGGVWVFKPVRKVFAKPAKTSS